MEENKERQREEKTEGEKSGNVKKKTIISITIIDFFSILKYVNKLLRLYENLTENNSSYLL